MAAFAVTYNVQEVTSCSVYSVISIKIKDMFRAVTKSWG